MRRLWVLCLTDTAVGFEPSARGCQYARMTDTPRVGPRITRGPVKPFWLICHDIADLGTGTIKDDLRTVGCPRWERPISPSKGLHTNGVRDHKCPAVLLGIERRLHFFQRWFLLCQIKDDAAWIGHDVRM